jgi:hypothetical protein
VLPEQPKTGLTFGNKKVNQSNKQNQIDQINQINQNN